MRVIIHVKSRKCGRPEQALISKAVLLFHLNKPLAIPPFSDNLSHMPTGKETSALERLLRPLSQNFTLELAGRRTEGQLTPDEQAELESIVRANTLLGVLKAEASAFLAHAKPS